MQLFAPPPADAQRAVLMKLLLSRYTQHVPALSPHPSFSQRATSSLMLLFPQLVKPQQLQRCQTAGDCDIISQCLTPIRPSQLCTWFNQWENNGFSACSGDTAQFKDQRTVVFFGLCHPQFPIE